MFEEWIPITAAMRTTFISLLAVVVLALLMGCNGLWLDTYWRSEKYVLLAIDTPGQMSLSIDEGHGSALELVGPTVFSIGANDAYIVLKQHPSKNAFGDFDRSITNYFIVTRVKSSNFADRKKGVRGPMNADEFGRLQKPLALPKFDKTFDELR